MIPSAFSSAVVVSGRVTLKRARTAVPGASMISWAMAGMSRLRPMRDDTIRTLLPFTWKLASRYGCSRVEKASLMSA